MFNKIHSFGHPIPNNVDCCLGYSREMIVISFFILQRQEKSKLFWPHYDRMQEASRRITNA